MTQAVLHVRILGHISLYVMCLELVNTSIAKKCSPIIKYITQPSRGPLYKLAFAFIFNK